MTDSKRCSAHEDLMTLVVRIDERTEGMSKSLEILQGNQRTDGNKAQRLSGAWSGAVKSAGLMLAFGAGLGAVIAAAVAVAKIVGG